MAAKIVVGLDGRPAGMWALNCALEERSAARCAARDRSWWSEHRTTPGWGVSSTARSAITPSLTHSTVPVLAIPSGDDDGVNDSGGKGRRDPH